MVPWASVLKRAARTAPDFLDMEQRELHIHMARAFLHQAAVVRHQGIHHGWHATLLRWAANRRLRAAAAVQEQPGPAQGELF